MKIELLSLVFETECYYVQKESIVEKVTFNNRTFYSKFERHNEMITDALLQQHLLHQISLAVPLVQEDTVNYLLVEYQQPDWRAFHSLLKHLLKSLDIAKCHAFYNEQKELFQLFIPRNAITLDTAYKEVENLKYHLELKSKKSYKIYPNINFPKNFNIITLPTQKI